MGLDAFEARCVLPFYLHMMGLNAIMSGPGLLPEIKAVAHTTAIDEVITLLRREWRPRVMGAWLSVFHLDDAEINDALLKSLATSGGSLTAPPLITMLVMATEEGGLQGHDEYVLEALRAYIAIDLEKQLGSAAVRRGGY